MTKKKSILLQVLLLLGICIAVIGALFLTGCSNDEPTFDGDDYFLTSTLGNITNQEAFELMIDLDGAVFILLDLVDEALLRGNYDFDDDEVQELFEEFKANIPDFDGWMLQEGFESEEEIIRLFELGEMRQNAVRHLVEVTDEQVEEVFAMWFNPEVDDFDEVRDEIYAELVAEEIRMINTEEIARMRYEADFEIFNETLAAAYEQYLDMFMFEIDLHEATSEVDSDVIARINGVDITIEQVFMALSNRFGLDVAFGYLDEIIIANNFLIDPAEINEIIDELREDFGDEFDEILAGAGFESEEALFDYFEGVLIEEAMLREHFPVSEEYLRELHAGMGPTVRGSHILVEEYDVALGLIEQLQDAGDDFSELFAELAVEYSLCGSAAGGGDLGPWEICSVPGPNCMVEEFDAAIVELEVGEFTDAPVETQFGYHIIYKTDSVELLEFEDVRDDLEAQELAQLQQIPGVLNDIMMTYREEVELEFMSSWLQDRFEFLVNGDVNMSGGE